MSRPTARPAFASRFETSCPFLSHMRHSILLFAGSGPLAWGCFGCIMWRVILLVIATITGH